MWTVVASIGLAAALFASPAFPTNVAHAHTHGRSVAAASGNLKTLIPNPSTEQEAGVFSFKAPQVIRDAKLTNGKTFFLSLFNLILLVALIIFIILIPIGGLRWMAASGNEEESASAKRLLTSAVIGLFIVLAAQGATTYLLSVLGNPNVVKLTSGTSTRTTGSPSSSTGSAESANSGSSFSLPPEVDSQQFEHETVTGKTATVILTAVDNRSTSQPIPGLYLVVTTVEGKIITGGTTDDAGRITMSGLPVGQTLQVRDIDQELDRFSSTLDTFTVPTTEGVTKEELVLVHSSPVAVPLTVSADASVRLVRVALFNEAQTTELGSAYLSPTGGSVRITGVPAGSLYYAVIEYTVNSARANKTLGSFQAPRSNLTDPLRLSVP